VKTELECLPCFFGQIARTLDYAGLNGDRGREITRKAEAIIEGASLDEVPARTSTAIHRLLRQETGVDPYRRVKETYNEIALRMLPALKRRAAALADPLEGAVRAAISGNVIDFGIYDAIDLDRAVEESFHLPLSSEYRSFQQAVQAARQILYLCDNSGEIVFDRILIETLQAMGRQVTVAVKGSPVINDATREDAAAAGLAGNVPVIDNGNDGIGTLLESCSSRFMDAFRSAELIISKGQANYETLVQCGDARIFFLFKVKCPVVARALQKQNGDIILMRNGGRQHLAGNGDRKTATG
jgi:uncharacterized protein with ATP-grasp and redox domains